MDEEEAEVEEVEVKRDGSFSYMYLQNIFVISFLSFIIVLKVMKNKFFNCDVKFRKQIKMISN